MSTHHTTYSFTFEHVHNAEAEAEIDSAMFDVCNNIMPDADTTLEKHWVLYSNHMRFGQPGAYPRTIHVYATFLGVPTWQPPPNFQIYADGRKYRPFVEWHDNCMDYPTQPLTDDETPDTDEDDVATDDDA